MEGARELTNRSASKPCPFLVDRECSIYEARPASCRLHVSLDDDNLLCRLVDGLQVPVPYVDSRMVYAITLAAQAAELIGDIRDFFPEEPAPSS